MSQTKSNYAPLLNALDDMKHSPVYAVRRGILQGAIDAIISLEVRLREIEQVSEVAERRVWQPIETAPKDGSRILLATPTGKLADGMWSTQYGVWSWPYVMAEPTHWMIALPIPSHESEQLKTAWYCGGCGQTDPSKRCLGCRA